MPTPEARALAEEVFYMDTPEEVALALDRFAVQRGAGATPEGHGPHDYDGMVCKNCGERYGRLTSTWCQKYPSAPPQTGGGAPDNELLHMTEHNVAVAAAAYCRYSRDDSKLLRILKDTLAERDRVAQQPIEPQTGGGDAVAKEHEFAAQFVDDVERAFAKPPPGGRDAGERARAAVEALPSHLFDRKHTEEIALNLTPEFEAALRSSHREGAEEARQDALRVPFTKALVAEARTQGYREGAEAMRPLLKYALMIASFAGTGGTFVINVNTANEASKACDAARRALPIPGKTDAP